MPKQIEYPRVSFEKSLELSKIVNDFGGKIDKVICADRLGVKASTGSFSALLSGAQKFELIQKEKDDLLKTDLSEKIFLAYNEEERREAKIESFLMPEVFQNLYERFKGSKLPLEYLSKLLIREYNVNEREASKISGYFENGLVNLELLDSDSNIIAYKEKQLTNQVDERISNEEKSEKKLQEVEFKQGIMDRKSLISTNQSLKIKNNKTIYVIIKSKDLNIELELNNMDDFDYLEYTLKHLKKDFKKGKGEEPNVPKDEGPNLNF